MGKVDEIRQLAEELGGLKERRRQLDYQIKELEAKLTAKGGSPKNSPDSQIVEKKVMAILDGATNRSFTVTDIEPLIPGVKKSTIRAAFSRLSAAEKIKRVKHGQYRSLLGQGAGTETGT